MRIAYVVSALRHAGPVSVVMQLAKQMVEHGHECKVFYFDENIFEPSFPAEKIDGYRPINFAHYDIVHAHGIRPNLYLTFYKPWFGKKTKFVTTIHCYIWEEFRVGFGRMGGSLFSLLFLASVRTLDKVVVLSDDAVGYYSRWVNAQKLARCYNGIDMPQGRLPVKEEEQVQQFKADYTLIGTCASLVKIKGVEQLIQALAQLPDRFRLLVIGEGNLRLPLQQRCAELGISHRIMFTGFVPEGHRYMPLMDVYVQTSLSEGFCLALTEAAMYGKKIVCADIRGMKEKYADDEITYYQSGRSDDLIKKILQAEKEEDKPLRAKRKACEQFSSVSMYEAYHALYLQLVQNKNRK